MTGEWLAKTVAKLEQDETREHQLETDLKEVRAAIAARRDDIAEYRRAHPEVENVPNSQKKKKLKQPILKRLRELGAEGIDQADLCTELDADPASLNNVLWRLERAGDIKRASGRVTLASPPMSN